MLFVGDNKCHVLFAAMAKHALATGDLRVVEDQEADVFKWYAVFAFVFANDQLIQMDSQMCPRGDLYRSTNHLANYLATGLDCQTALSYILSWAVMKYAILPIWNQSRKHCGGVEGRE